MRSIDFSAPWKSETMVVSSSSLTVLLALSMIALSVGEAKIEMAKRIRKENNMKDRNGGEAAGSLR